MKNALFVLLALVVAPAVAFAGGGSKSNGTIYVTNNSGETALVIVNPPNTLDPATAGDAEFTAAGGQKLTNGKKAAFSVKEGTANVYALYIDATGAIRGPVGMKAVAVKKRGIYNLGVTGDSAGLNATTFTGP